MRNIFLSISAVLSLFVMSSCHRQVLEDVLYNKALIPVIIDWETRALLYVDNDPENDLYSASVWLFPTPESEYQGEPLEYRLGDPEYGYIEVPVGEYDVLVFNKTISDYSDNVGFRGTNGFDTFEYYVNYDTRASLFSKVDDKEEAYSYPDMLAAWSTNETNRLKVTLDMLGYYEFVKIVRSRVARSRAEDTTTKVTADDLSDLDPELLQLTNIVTERLVHNVTTKVDVTNLRSATSAEGSLLGMSSSVLLASHKYSTSTVSHNALFTSRVFTDEEKRNGYLLSNFNVIGPLESDSDYSVKLLFTLVDEYEGSILYPTPPAAPFVRDVSSQVNNAEIGLEKHLDLYIDEAIDLPDVSLGGGFDIGVDDWGETVIIPLMN